MFENLTSLFIFDLFSHFFLSFVCFASKATKYLVLQPYFLLLFYPDMYSEQDLEKEKEEVSFKDVSINQIVHSWSLIRSKESGCSWA